MRKCIHCGQPGGTGKRELRPYGPNGTDVCAGCVFGGPPERKREAERQLGARLMATEPLVLDADEQVGPRPLNPKGTS